MVRAILGLRDEPASDHAADALAVAVCDLNRAPLAAAVARAPVPLARAEVAR
jgi:Holliday junction resolvasome RuvABC endonuclease subunit